MSVYSLCLLEFDLGLVTIKTHMQAPPGPYYTCSVTLFKFKCGYTKVFFYLDGHVYIK